MAIRLGTVPLTGDLRVRFVRLSGTTFVDLGMVTVPVMKRIWDSIVAAITQDFSLPVQRKLLSFATLAGEGGLR